MIKRNHLVQSKICAINSITADHIDSSHEKSLPQIKSIHLYLPAPSGLSPLSFLFQLLSHSCELYFFIQLSIGLDFLFQRQLQTLALVFKALTLTIQFFSSLLSNFSWAHLCSVRGPDSSFTQLTLPFQVISIFLLFQGRVEFPAFSRNFLWLVLSSFNYNFSSYSTWGTEVPNFCLQ